MAVLTSNHLCLEVFVLNRSADDPTGHAEIRLTLCSEREQPVLEGGALLAPRIQTEPPRAGSLYVGGSMTDLVDSIRECETKNIATDWSAGGDHAYLAFYPGLYYPHIIQRCYNDALRVPNRNQYPVDDFFTVIAAIPGRWFSGPVRTRFTSDPMNPIVEPTSVSLQLLVFRNDFSAFADTLFWEFRQAPLSEGAPPD